MIEIKIMLAGLIGGAIAVVIEQTLGLDTYLALASIFAGVLVGVGLIWVRVR